MSVEELQGNFGKYDPRTLGVASQTWQEDFAMKGLLEVVQEINRIKPETTRNLRSMFSSMERMGRNAMMSPINNALMMPQRQMGIQIGNSIQTALMPTTLLMNQMVNQVSNAIIPYISQNRTGAGIGGLAGFVAGYALPGGPMLWSLIGTGVGVATEAALTSPGVPFQDLLNATPWDPLGAQPSSTTWEGQEQYDAAISAQIASTDPIPIIRRGGRIREL